MADFVYQFRRVVQLLLKWTAIALALILVAIAAAFAIGAGMDWFTYDRHAKLVEVTAAPDRNECPNDAKPIHVQVKNRSAKTITESSVYLIARRPNRSSDVSNASGSNDPTTTRTAAVSDHAILGRREPLTRLFVIYLLCFAFIMFGCSA